MKRMSLPRCLMVRSTCVIGVLGFVVTSAFGQGARDMYHPLPDGQGAAAAAAAAQAEESEKTTIYDKSGTQEKPATNPYGSGGGRRSRFNYGKLGEIVVNNTDSKTSPIQKTKDGSGDVTVPTGVFKESFLDVGLTRAAAPAVSATPMAKVNPLRNSPTKVEPSSATAQPAASPQPTAAAAPSAPARLDITLGVSPPPNLTPTPTP